MRIIIVGLLMAIFTTSSCSEQKRPRFLKRSITYQPFLFNMQHYFSDQELNMSFPIWFNDTILKQNRIKEIRLSVYSSSQDTSVNENYPKRTKVYTFNEDGDIVSAQFEQFYENVKVGSYLFDYATSKDENGFSKVEKTVGPNSDLKASEHYTIYEKEKCNDKFLIYRDELSGDYLFYMLNRKNWGALSVDSIFNPTIEDKVIFGSPQFPYKSYHVENVVKESEVIEYEYDKKNEFVLQIKRDEYPFRNKRSVNYSKSGDCLGFVDSTFSGDKFLKAELTIFEIEGQLPRKIIHESKLNESGSGYFHIETIEYIFFEEK
ncbi:MAG: hypothetical protein ACPGVI_02210 [Crocinitomicaceae bacterium]|jgi:hypothetical protein